MIYVLCLLMLSFCLDGVWEVAAPSTLQLHRSARSILVVVVVHSPHSISFDQPVRRKLALLLLKFSLECMHPASPLPVVATRGDPASLQVGQPC